MAVRVNQDNFEEKGRLAGAVGKAEIIELLEGKE